MRKVILYIAMSLNGKIARKNGKVDWLESLPNPENTDHGYNELLQSVDTTIMGNSTYKQLISWGIEFPYKHKKNYVFTRNKSLSANENVEFISENHLDFIKTLKNEPGKHIWLIGGGQLNTLFFNAGLIDEFRVFVMPVIIPDGIEIFELLPLERYLVLYDSVQYSSGAVELIYTIE